MRSAMQWATSPLLLLALLVGQAHAQPAPAAAPAERTILVMGDSLSAGYNMAAAQGWVALLGQRYRDAGVRDVTVRVYDGARHEVFNETNRDEVTADVIDWLAAHS